MNLAIRPERNHTNMEIASRLYDIKPNTEFNTLRAYTKTKENQENKKTIVFSYVILVFLCFLIARFADYLAWNKLHVVTCFISDISNEGYSTPR